MVKYDEFSTKFYCREHRLAFSKGSSCPKCSTLPPSFPVEGKVLESVNPSNSTSNSQAITSNSQGVCVRRRYVRRVKDSVFERFHNHGLRFSAVVDWPALFKFDEVKLRNNVSYKRVDFSGAIVKVFRRSILVTLRSRSEIVGLSVREAEFRSLQLINDVLDGLPSAIVVSVKDRECVSLHNAFVNHPVAKRDVNVSIGGVKRLISDNSKGYSEFEAVSPVHAVSDSEALEQDIVSLVDKGLSRDFIAQSINKLVQDREFWAKHQISHVEAIQTLSRSVKEFSSVVRYDRVKRLKDEWW